MIEAISEITNEVETSIENIAAQSSEHIHTDEIILTLGRSKTVEEFLKRAAKRRKFHVIIAESEPYLQVNNKAIVEYFLVVKISK
jgi:translation initiation factor eIF-2B subunit beta